MRAASLACVCLSWSCVAAPTRDLVKHDPAQPPDPRCPAAVFARVRSADLSSAAASTLFGALAPEAIECQVAALRVVAGRLDSASHPLVIGDFCSTAATLSRFLPADARDDVKAAYLRFPYHDSLHADYFLGLRANHIDLRPHLRGKIAEDWSFEHPRRDAATWHHYLYLASLDEPGAYTKLAAKIAGTTSGNDVTNLLTSLAELGTDAAKDIVMRYASDTRRADGPSGPAMPLSETVARLLAMHFPQRPD